MVAVVANVKYKVSFSYGKYCFDKGVTRCYVQDESGLTLGLGEASCAPQDQFNKVIGRKLALSRALRDAGIPKAERTEIWEQFKATHKYVA